MAIRSINYHQVENDLLREQQINRLLNEQALEIAPPPDSTEGDPYENEPLGPRYRITPILRQILPCPICKIAGRHTSRIYDTYEINTCEINPDDRHSWRVDYQTVGTEEIYWRMKEDLQLAVSLLNEAQNIFTDFDYLWGKNIRQRDRKHIERAKLILSRLREILDNSYRSLPGDDQSCAVATHRGVVQATDFKQEIDGRFCIGARLFRNEQDAERAVELVVEKYFIRPRLAVIPASDIYSDDRFVLALPRDPRNTLEATFTTMARSFLETLPGEDFPEPDMPLVSAVLPAGDERPERRAGVGGTRRKETRRISSGTDTRGWLSPMTAQTICVRHASCAGISVYPYAPSSSSPAPIVPRNAI